MIILGCNKVTNGLVILLTGNIHFILLKVEPLTKKVYKIFLNKKKNW